jgi:hypothetical protein
VEVKWQQVLEESAHVSNATQQSRDTAPAYVILSQTDCSQIERFVTSIRLQLFLQPPDCSNLRPIGVIVYVNETKAKCPRSKHATISPCSSKTLIPSGLSVVHCDHLSSINTCTMDDIIESKLTKLSLRGVYMLC